MHPRPTTLARSHPRLGFPSGVPLVRALLVPAPLHLGGRATWWPAPAAPTTPAEPRPTPGPPLHPTPGPPLLPAPGPPLQTPPPPAPCPSHD